MTYSLGELFCGPGGIALGARRAVVTDPVSGQVFRTRHAWATDYDADTCETYRRNICPDSPGSVLCADIRKLDMQRLADISGIDGLAFGFPCNDYSMVGEQKGIDGEFGPLYRFGVKALQLFRPSWFLAENVGGLKSSNKGTTLDRILQELHGCGYSLFPHFYCFEHYGVPQTRHRIIIIGIREDIPAVFRVPSPTTPEPLQQKTCQEAIEVPPIPQGHPNHELTRQSAQVVARLQNTRPGENAFNATLPEHLQLNVRGARISQIYRRLDPARPAYTVTGSGGGGTHVYHWSEPRALTNRERARLQTFPDDFVFCGSKESVRRQIGMAVPPQGVEHIFRALLMTLAGQTYPSVRASFSPLLMGPHLSMYNAGSQAGQLQLCEDDGIT